MTPIKSRPLIDQEIEELDAFLLSDDGLENAMDVSGLDGFLCAVLSGPNVIMPSEWMRWVWDSTEGKQSPEFTSEKQAQRIHTGCQYFPSDWGILTESRLKSFPQPIDRNIAWWRVQMHFGFQKFLKVEQDMISSFFSCLLLGLGDIGHRR